jgi:hypothetical protein
MGGRWRRRHLFDLLITFTAFILIVKLEKSSSHLPHCYFTKPLFILNLGFNRGRLPWFFFFYRLLLLESISLLAIALHAL